MAGTWHQFPSPRWWPLVHWWVLSGLCWPFHRIRIPSQQFCFVLFFFSSFCSFLFWLIYDLIIDIWLKRFPDISTSTINSILKQVGFSYGESPRTPPLEGTSLHRRNNSAERPSGVLSLFTTTSDYVSILSRVCRWHRHICMWCFCEAGRFSYGESLRTPPLEGTSLHWRNSIVEKH